MCEWKIFIEYNEERKPVGALVLPAQPLALQDVLQLLQVAEVQDAQAVKVNLRELSNSFFYDLPSRLNTRATGLGYGNKSTIVLP